MGSIVSAESIRTVTFTVTTSLMLVAGMLFGANAASADSVQVQSYQRASQTEACVAQAGETAWQANWGTDSSWKPAYEMWANGGHGGWTCTRSITWAKTPVPASSSDGGSVTYRVGDVGPGGGLVFLISGGLRYEMAPKAWNGGVADPGMYWCASTPNLVSGAFGSAVGAGFQNTLYMAAAGACNSAAVAAVLAYPGTDGSAGQWFLPSKDELNAMCNYSRNPTLPAAPGIRCTGAQNSGFASDNYGFFNSFSDNYWSSTQGGQYSAYLQVFLDGIQASIDKANGYHVRPVRSF